MSNEEIEKRASEYVSRLLRSYQEHGTAPDGLVLHEAAAAYRAALTELLAGEPDGWALDTRESAKPEDRCLDIMTGLSREVVMALIGDPSEWSDDPGFKSRVFPVRIIELEDK